MNKKGIGLLVAVGAMSMIFTGCSLFNDNEPVNNPQDDQHQQQEQQENKNEYIKTEEDGTRVNTSDKIKKAKFTIDGLEISNIQLSELVGKTSLTADVKNSTEEKKGDIELTINLYKKDGSVDQLFHMQYKNFCLATHWIAPPFHCLVQYMEGIKNYEKN